MEHVEICDSPQCGKCAMAFGLKETNKIRSCEGHFTNLIMRKMLVYTMDWYYFISNQNDPKILKQRCALEKKGRENLTVLEASCESELTEALQTIQAVKAKVLQSVEDRFEEMKTVVTGVYNDIKNQFAEVKLNYKKFLYSKKNELSYTASLLCRDLSVIPRFLRFGVADVSDHISAVVGDSWTVASADFHSTLKCLDETQKQEAIDNALTEALQQAAKGIQEALRYADLLTGEISLNEDEVQVTSKQLSWKKERTEKSLKWTQRSWDLRQRYQFPASTTVKVGQKLANLLCSQLRQFSTAEEILRHSYDIASIPDPLSEDVMSLCADICGVYAASEQFEQLESLGKWTLRTFETSAHPPEHYWTLILYLVYSLHQLGKKAEAAETLHYWEKIRTENKPSEMLQLIAMGIHNYYEGKEAEAEGRLLQARHIGTKHFPTSLFTAVALSHLALVCAENSREQLYRQAQAIYEVAAPMSIYAASNLNRLGLLLCSAKRLREAEECHRQALSVYETIVPQSENVAASLFNVAQVYEAMGQTGHALECVRKAAAACTKSGNEGMKSAAEDLIARLTTQLSS